MSPALPELKKTEKNEKILWIKFSASGFLGMDPSQRINLKCLTRRGLTPGKAICGAKRPPPALFPHPKPQGIGVYFFHLKNSLKSAIFLKKITPRSRINNLAAELGLSVRLNLTHKMKKFNHNGAPRRTKER
jgi:hypothetical protein